MMPVFCSSGPFSAGATFCGRKPDCQHVREGMLVMEIRVPKRDNARCGISIPEVGCLAAVLVLICPQTGHGR
jgi:hypothetical protein